MPTTRSSKRSSETFQTLEAPKRSRKIQPTPSCAPVKNTPIPRTFPKTEETSPILAQIKPNYVSIGTQTDDVIMLTPKKAADLEEKAASNSSQKRSREDDLEDDHRSKRVMFTPQPNPDRTLWMFPSATSAHAPRTAPAKSFGSSSIRRPRGLMSRTPQYRRKIGANSESIKVPRMIAPVEIDDTETQPEKHHNGAAAEHVEEETPQPTTPTPKPSQSSLFGSMRGLAATGLNFISHLSPRRASAQTPPPASIAKQPRPSAYQPTVTDHNEEENTPTQEQDSPQANDEENDTSTRSPLAARPQREAPVVPGLYDHLHIYTEDNLPNGRLKFPPRAPTPPDPLELMKKNHPDMPEAHLRHIVEKRQREREQRERDFGIPANPKPIVKAPLFGPDSHYARGTVDPTLFLEKPLCFYTEEELLNGPTKRKYDAVEASTSEDAAGSINAQDEAGTITEATETDGDNGEDLFMHTPTTKRQRTALPATPRSAMKKGGDFGTSIGRSSRSVLFKTNPVSGSRDLRAHYGPAGQYRGSTFADKSPPSRRDDSTMSSLDYSDIISPSTKLNTLANTNAPTGYDAMVQLERNLGADIPQIDFSARDPSDPEWRPSISNPRPGSFRVPFLDEEDEDMDTDDGESSPQAASSEKTPAQPSTPRMSHAELPGPPASIASSINPDSILFESTELALEKARSAAQKYKPKDSSRLSEVSQATSRSPSPDTHDFNTIYETDDDYSTPRQRTTAPAVRPLGAPPQPFVAPQLDNITAGEDGMTDHEREHQHDEWAANLDWAAPQTYEEAGTCTKEISELIRKNWTAEDDRRSEEFWHREFEMIEREQIDALRKGKTLQFITGMEDAYMEGVAV